VSTARRGRQTTKHAVQIERVQRQLMPVISSVLNRAHSGRRADGLSHRLWGTGRCSRVGANVRTPGSRPAAAVGVAARQRPRGLRSGGHGLSTPLSKTARAQLGWLGSRLVRSGAEVSSSNRSRGSCRVTVFGKLFTPIVPLSTKQRNW